LPIKHGTQIIRSVKLKAPGCGH